MFFIANAFTGHVHVFAGRVKLQVTRPAGQGQYLNILNKSEDATLQLSIFCEKVLDKKYLLKLNNVSQTSSNRFIKTPPICLV